jgi:hypothetical protein
MCFAKLIILSNYNIINELTIIVTDWQLIMEENISFKKNCGDTVYEFWIQGALLNFAFFSFPFGS